MATTESARITIFSARSAPVLCLFCASRDGYAPAASPSTCSDCDAPTHCDSCAVLLDEGHNCPDCGVYHGEPCDACGRCGYHVDGCSTTAGA